VSICEAAAGQSAWDRHCEQALAIVAPARPVVLLAIEGGWGLTAPGADHPASRALSAPRGGIRG